MVRKQSVANIDEDFIYLPTLFESLVNMYNSTLEIQFACWVDNIQ